MSNKACQINLNKLIHKNCTIDTIKDSDEVLYKENTPRSNQIRIRNKEPLNQNCANVFHAAESNGSNISPKTINSSGGESNVQLN